MKFVFILFIAFLSNQTNCNSKVNKIDKTLTGCWMNSYEEQEGDIRIYRPCNSRKFAPSRFRHFLELKEDGTHTYLWLAPNDAHQSKQGRWQFNAETQILTLTTAEGENEQLKIEEFSSDILKFSLVR